MTFTKNNPEIGARPGTLAIPPGSPPPKITVVQYGEGTVDRREITDANEVRALRDGHRVTWVDIQGLGDEAMLREQSPFPSEQVKIYLRGTHDPIAQIVEPIDSAREMASDMSEADLSNVSHRTNEIMKVLTLMASIFIPLTFVAGIHGMNFEYMPELSNRNGYFQVLVVMVVVAVAMAASFRHRGWIGTPPPPEFRDEDPPEDT